MAKKRSRKPPKRRLSVARLREHWSTTPLGESRCIECKREMAAGAVVLLIDTVTGTDPEMGGEYYRRDHLHLTCAIEHRPEDIPIALSEMDVGALEDIFPHLQAVPASLLADAVARLPPRKAMPLDDPRTLELLGELERLPEDRALLGVLGDHLLQRGDERGELIQLQLAGSHSPRLAELFELLRPKFNTHDHQGWGIGFLHDAHFILGGASFDDGVAKLAHPSCRLLQKLTVWQNQPRSPQVVLPSETVPHTLRVLDVIGGLATGDLSWLPYLERLVVDECHAIAHPTLRSVDLRATDAETIEACGRGLPKLERLMLERTRFGRVPTKKFGELLDASGLLARLRELELVGLVANDTLRERALHHDIRLVERPMKKL